MVFMENRQTINDFYNVYTAKCEKKFGMKSGDVISLNSWKEDQTFIPLKKNKRFLKECVKGKVWPKDMSDLDLNQGK